MNFSRTAGFVIVALAAYYAVKKLWAQRDEDGGCSSCDTKPSPRARH